MCSDERCSGDHNDRHWATLCPRTKERKLAIERDRYDHRMTNLEYNRDLLRLRRYRAVQRMNERGLRGALQK